MGIYRTICHKVEDMFVTILTKKQEPEVVKQKVNDYRTQKDEKKAEQKKLQNAKREEQEKLRKEQQEKKRQEVEALQSTMMDSSYKPYTQYEFNEIKKNTAFFQALNQRVLEDNEKVLTFIYCEFDKSSKKEIKGYLLATSKRVLFLTKNLNFMDKFRYQTIVNVNWFADGILERGLKIQYGKRRLEFDEMYDSEQMKRVGNTILTQSSNF